MLLKNTRTIALIALFGSSMASAADTVSFKMNGEIKSGTCSFRNDTVIFDLGSHEKNIFTGVGSTSPWVNRSLVSAGCSGVSLVHMTFQATPDTTDNQLFAVEGGAEGVAVELKSYDDHPAVPDNTTKISWASRGDGQEYKYKARYKQTKPDIISGPANANIIVNLTYD